MTPFDDIAGCAFLFPGIGVKPFGKEGEFYTRYRAIIEPYFRLGSAMAGSDLAGLLSGGATFAPAPICHELFAYAFSFGAFQVFRAHGLLPKLVAGHSLGVYAALAAAGAIGFADGLAIALKAHQLGRTNAQGRHFGVAVIIGLAHDEVTGAITMRGLSTVNLANLNNASSGVYVGARDEIENLLRWAEQAGAIKTIRLDIAIPFHSPLFMQEASMQLRGFLESLPWQRPVCPVLSALDHRLLTSQKQLIEMTAANLSQPIDWPGVLQTLTGIGIRAVVECGAGVSLSQHARFIDDAPRHYNLRNLKRRLNY